MRKFKFITTLRFLGTPDPIDGELTLMPGIDLINDRNKINEIVDDELKGIAGIIEAAHLANADHIIFCDASEEIFSKNHSSNEALIVWLVWLDMVISDSWLIKDNSMACEVAFCKMTDGKHMEWSSNYLSNPVSIASGEQYKTVAFATDELKEWESKSHKLQSYLHSNKSGAFASFTNKQYSRIGRARRFISAARKESHPAIKISHYCSAFESLFSTDNAELSHKLSERVALFLKQNDFDPMVVFDDMKQFYGIRSKVTHGDSIQAAREKELGNLSNRSDFYLRSIFNIILGDEGLQRIFDGNKNEFEKHFKQLLFS